MSDDDEEDGQISRLEQDEEREQRLLNKLQPDEDPLASSDDIISCQLKRDDLVTYSNRKWFEDYVKGTISAIPLSTGTLIAISKVAGFVTLLAIIKESPFTALAK